MKGWIGNWYNDYVTEIDFKPSVRQIINALKRMNISLTKIKKSKNKMVFRYAPVDNVSIDDDTIHKLNNIIIILVGRERS